MLTLLGATGSIGCNTLNILRLQRDIPLFALTAKSNITLLAQQCMEFSPHYAVVPDGKAATQLENLLRQAQCSTEVLAGEQALINVCCAEPVTKILVAINGAIALLPALEAAKAQKTILLANKEALVMSGELFIQTVKKHHATLLPIDSEHNAVWQCLPENYQMTTRPHYVEKIILTASGGPFLSRTPTQLKDVTPAEACAHPTWKMGQKISVDSATMMNKGLEIIEARWLFDMKPAEIEAVIHPTSTVHAFVQYEDGTTLMHAGLSDMRVAISRALAWPQRIHSGVPALNIAALSSLTFLPVKFEQFPCFALATQALKAGGGYPCVLNAANEVAVAEFLQGKIGFLEIAQVVEATLSQTMMTQVDSLEAVLALDKEARRVAQEISLAVSD